MLLNYYRDGQDSVAWHSDNEIEMGSHPVIASVSFGQVRGFDIRKKTDHSKKYAVRLEHGSQLVMKGDLRTKCDHRIPKSTRPMGIVPGLTITLYFNISFVLCPCPFGHIFGYKLITDRCGCISLIFVAPRMI